MCCGMQKKSREESSGSGSGVEILVNEPYSDGPGGAGQYTQKIYHIGSHLPGTSLLQPHAYPGSWRIGAVRFLASLPGFSLIMFGLLE